METKRTNFQESKSSDSDEKYFDSRSENADQEQSVNMLNIMLGDALDDQDLAGLLMLEGLADELVEKDVRNIDQTPQVQAISRPIDSDSESSDSENDADYDPPVMFQIRGGYERVIKFTDIFIPKSERLKRKLRLHNNKTMGFIHELENEQARANKRRLKSDYKDLEQKLEHKALNLPVNNFLEDFYYLKNISRQGVPNKKVLPEAQKIYKAISSSNLIVQKIQQRLKQKQIFQEQKQLQKSQQLKYETSTKNASDIESEEDQVLESCRVEELKHKFIQPTPYRPKENGKVIRLQPNFTAPHYTSFEKQMVAYLKATNENTKPLLAQDITDHMMQEWMIEQKYAQLSDNGVSVKRSKYWGELKDASSIQQLEKDQHVITKFQSRVPQSFKPKLHVSYNQQQKSFAVENFKEYEIMKQKTEELFAPRQSKVTAASIMRTIRFRMGQITPQQYYELELKDKTNEELQQSMHNNTLKKEQIIANFDENFDTHFKNKEREIQIEIMRKKEAKDKANQQNQKQPLTTAYEPIIVPEPMKGQKDAAENQEDKNMAQDKNSDQMSSSSDSDDESYTVDRQKEKDRVLPTLGDELNHAKCIEGHSFYKLDWSNKDLQYYHRPNIQEPFSEVQNIQSFALESKDEEAKIWLNAHEKFKDRYKLSIKKGKFCIFEHVDQFPLFVNNFGMASRLKRYYYGDKMPSEKIFRQRHENKETRHMGPHGQIELKKAPQFIDATKPELGLIPKQHLQLTGQINTSLFKGITVLENKMYNAPVFYHTPNRQDSYFFCSLVSTQNNEKRIYLRELDNLYTVGQIEPKLEVYNPQSRDFQNFIKKRSKAYIIRLLQENQKINQKIKFNDIQNFFPSMREQILKNGLKEIEVEIDRNGECKFTRNFEEERFKDRMTPEMICQYESACHGQFRLQRIGVVEIVSADKISYSTNKFIREETDMIFRRIAKLIEKEVLSTPWNLSSSFIKVNQTKEMMMRVGDGDPSYGHGGYSFLKMPLKISADSLQGAKENRMNLNPAIKNPKAVTKTDADLRKLHKKEIFVMLLQAGFSEDQLANKTRWDMVGMLRHSATDKDENQKFQRGVRYTSDKQRQQYNININLKFEEQMKNLSSKNPEYVHAQSEDEPDFTEPNYQKTIKLNQSRNATDYTDEIVNDKDPITKLSVETTDDVVGEIKSIEDIPNYENLLLLKLDKVPQSSGSQNQGISLTTSQTSLTLEILENLPQENLDQLKAMVRQKLDQNEIKPRVKVLCLRIRNLNLISEDCEPVYNRVLFFSSEKLIKKFERYKNKHEGQLKTTRKPRMFNPTSKVILGTLTAERLDQVNSRSCSVSVSSQKGAEVSRRNKQPVSSVTSGLIGSKSVNTAQIKKQQPQKKEQPSQPIIKVNFNANNSERIQPIEPSSQPIQIQMTNTIQLKLPNNVEEENDKTPDQSEQNNSEFQPTDLVNCEDEEMEDQSYSQPHKIVFVKFKQQKQQKTKKQSSQVSKFKNAGVSREDFEYNQPLSNIGSTRRRQQQYDQALNVIFRDIVTELMSLSISLLFHNQVSSKEAPNYRSIVQRPICLKDMLSKTKRSDYKSSRDFMEDFQLMKDNAIKYNGENFISNNARELERLAQSKITGKIDEILTLETLVNESISQI